MFAVIKIQENKSHKSGFIESVLKKVSCLLVHTMGPCSHIRQEYSRCLVRETELLVHMYPASLECPPLYSFGLKSNGLQMN